MGAELKNGLKRVAEQCRNLRVLILSKEFGAQGGVVNFVSTLMAHSSAYVEFAHLSIGRRSGGGKALSAIGVPLVDNVALVLRSIRVKPDCIHMNPSFNFKSLLRDGLLMLTAGVVVRKPIVVFFHGWDTEHERRVKGNPVLRLIIRKVFGRASVVLVLASRFRDALVDIGFKAEKIAVFTTMFDGKVFDGVTRRARTGERTVVFLSRFVREKGVYEVLEAFGFLQKRFGNLRLVMAGDGPERQSVEAWVVERGLEKKVEFPGYVRGRRKAQVLVDGDVFAFPSYYGEGCPVAVLEAMAAGLAIVTSGAGGLADIFLDNTNGVLLKNVTSGNVAAGIAKLLGDEPFLERVRKNNKREAWERYEARMVTARMERIYGELGTGPGDG